jgi:hypothetical protein
MFSVHTGGTALCGPADLGGNATGETLFSVGIVSSKIDGQKAAGGFLRSSERASETPRRRRSDTQAGRSAVSLCASRRLHPFEDSDGYWCHRGRHVSINSLGLALRETPFCSVKEPSYSAEGILKTMDGYFNNKLIIPAGE